jgi:hypothetical protein
MTDGWQNSDTQRVPSTGQTSVSILSWPSTRASLSIPPRESEWPLAVDEIPPLAAHVVSSRFGYTHHGIHVGDGRVIHYSGLSRGWRGGPVEEVSLAEFGRGRSIRVRLHEGARFDRHAVIARARSRLGESRYRALSNNCEHLCTWCIYGENRSRQVEVLRAQFKQVAQAVRSLVEAPVRLRSLLGLGSHRRSVPCDAC